jgi:shikimate kinase
MKMNKPVFLIGPMGCGKTYWGLRMAARLGVPFYDLDVMIVEKKGISIPEIFSQFGEATFRLWERNILHTCASLGSCIFASGGGTPCFFDNMAWMNSNGKTIYLKTSATVLAERLLQERQTRPLLSQIAESALESYLSQLLTTRDPYYMLAQVMIEQEGDPSVFHEKLLAVITSEN